MLTVEMNPNDRLEIGFGRVLAGREQWMYGEYFPAAGPVFAQYGSKTLVSFAVLGSNIPDINPAQGSLSSWPAAKNRLLALEHPTVAALLPERDAALSMSDGHMFEPLSEAVSFNPDGEFALIIGANVSVGEAIFQQPLAADSNSRIHEGRSLSLVRWNSACESLLTTSPEDVVILWVRLNTPSA